MRKLLFITAIVAPLLQSNGQTVTDYEGNTYNTVTIGTQTWLKENLKSTKYNDGIAIPNVTNTASWDALTSPGYCWYNNNEATYKATAVGALYNWYTVQTAKLCPTGWHVPTDSEWIKLFDYLTANGFGYEGSGDDIAKSMASKTGWRQCSLLGTPGNNPESNNSSSFSAVLTGDRDNMGGSFLGIDYSAEWWSSTESSSTESLYRYIAYDRKVILNYAIPKAYGLSVRCLKDDIGDPINTLIKLEDNVVYPNPAKDRLYIKNISSPDAVVSIYSLQGNLVLKVILDPTGIDISSLVNSTYLVKISTSKYCYIHKIIKI